MRLPKIMQDRVFANKKIEPIWDTVVNEYIPDEKRRNARRALAKCEDE